MALQASEARQAWRLRQGAAAISLDECVVRVADPRALDPAVTLERVRQWDSPSRTLVSEMMILAGQVAATVGEHASYHTILPGSLTAFFKLNPATLS